MFEKIYESATKGSIYNKEIFDKNEQEKKEEIENSTKEERIRKEASNSKWEVSNEMPLRKNVFSSFGSGSLFFDFGIVPDISDFALGL